MKRHKLNSEQQQEHTEQQSQQAGAREFATVEEMLRYDAAHTRIPPGIAQRLKQSAGPAPAPSRSWWRRFFGGGNS